MKLLVNRLRIRSRTQEFVEVVDVIGGIVILQNGDYLKIVQVQPVNFSLLNPDEQSFLIKKFATFINSLDFPIQIYIENHKIVMNDYLDFLQTVSQKITSPKLNAYLKIYARFIGNIIEFKTVFDRRFFIIVKHHTSVYNRNAPASLRQVLLESVNNHLTPKVNQIITHFKHMGLDARELNTEEVVKLLYKIYNPEAKQINFEDGSKINL